MVQKLFFLVLSVFVFLSGCATTNVLLAGPLSGGGNTDTNTITARFTNNAGIWIKDFNVNTLDANVGDVDFEQIFGSFSYGVGSYTNQGYDHIVKVYAFRNTAAGRVYSAVGDASGTFTDNNFNNTVYTIEWTWDAIANADGYRLLKKNDNKSGSCGFNYNYYKDVSTNALTDSNCTIWSAGSNVLPSSISNRPDFGVDNLGRRVDAWGTFCINNDCKSAWPAGGGGTADGNVYSLGVLNRDKNLFLVNSGQVTGKDWNAYGGVNANTYRSLDNNTMFLQTNNVNRLTLFTDGNVGVADATPDALLDVNGVNGNRDVFTVDANRNSYPTRFVVDKNGNVGIGARKPVVQLDVNGTAFFRYNVAIGPSLSTTATLNAVDDLMQVGIYSGNAATRYVSFTTGEWKVGVDGLSSGMFEIVNANGGLPISSTDSGLQINTSGNLFLPAINNGSGDSAMCYDSATFEVLWAGIDTCILSAARFKENIVDYTGDALATIGRLNVRTFDYQSQYRKAGERIGLIADEVKLVEPRLVQNDVNGNPLTLRFESITALNVAAIQELKAENDLLRSELCKRDSSYGFCR